MLSDHMHQDIARSSYADMLNDDERNRAYNYAIEFNVTSLVTSKVSNPNGDRFFKCCDIGTGSGLLSMMIVRSFKKLNYNNFHVHAFEAFQPMAECAKRVIEQNDMSNHISVIPTRSDLYEAEQNPQFDLLVAELLDTELIGEGCLEIYRHAIQNLCSPNCLFIPHAARIYLEPVASKRLHSRHAIDDLKFFLGTGNYVRINIADEIRNCPGMPEIDDMQVSALKEGEDFTRFTRPQQVFEFVFGDLETLKLSDYKTLTFTIEKTISEPPVVIMWWDIVMYDSSLDQSTAQIDGMISSTVDHSLQQHSWEVLSCAPTWARSAEQLARDQYIREAYGREVWREHWIQGVYYFSSVPETRALVDAKKSGYHYRFSLRHLNRAPSVERPARTNQPIVIHAYHDSFSLWFDLKQCETKLPSNCACGIHRKFSRSQLASLSDSSQMTCLIKSTLHPYTRGNSGNFEDNPVTIPGEIEFHHQEEEALGDTVELPSSSNGPKWTVKFVEPGSWACCHPASMRELSTCLEDLALAGEIPWSYIMMKYLDSQAGGGKLLEPVRSFEIKFTQVQFDNLNRIRTNIRECEGFNLCDLDDMINYSAKYVDKELEAHYLWEYPCTRIDSNDYTVFSSLDSWQPHDDPADEPNHKLMREKINSGTYWRHFSLPIFGHHEQQQDDAGRPTWQKGWALVFWAELQLEHSGYILSLGPMRDLDDNWMYPHPRTTGVGKQIEWNHNCKQLVYFLHDHPLIAPPQTNTAELARDDGLPSIHLDVGLSKFQLMVQRAVDYNTSPLKSKRRDDNE